MNREMITNIKNAGGIPLGNGGYIEYDWLLHRQKDYVGIIRMDTEAQLKERMSVKRYAECPNCYVICPANENIVRFNLIINPPDK